MTRNRAFRIVMSAIVVVCGVACLLIIASGFTAKGDTGRTYVEPRNATPTEISVAALEGQIEALRKAEFDKDCLHVIGMYGKLCIEQCVADGMAGFSLRLYTDHPRCTLKSCTCEGGAEEPLQEPSS